MLQYRSCNMLRYSLSCNMLVWMCSAHVNQRSSKNCIIPLGVGAARGDYSGLGFLTQNPPSLGARLGSSIFVYIVAMICSGLHKLLS